jgi:hypothetical protein
MERRSGQFPLHQIKEALQIYGLHVTLHIDDLPGNECRIDFRKDEDFWTNERFSLFQIHVKPATYWLTFSASTFPDHGHMKDEFHISLCYMSELQSWYQQMKTKNGTDSANSSLCMWFDNYRTMRTKYNNKEAYIIGPVTKGGLCNYQTELVSLATKGKKIRSMTADNLTQKQEYTLIASDPVVQIRASFRELRI